MRKQLLRLLLCGMVMTGALTCGALASEGALPTEPTVTPNTGVGTLTYVKGANNSVTYTAGCSTDITSGKQYVLMVVQANEPAVQAAGTFVTPTYEVNEKNITYIDQKAADGTSISFDFIPRSAPYSVVLLGGDFEGSPKVLGTLKGAGVSVSGSVNYYRVNPWSVHVSIRSGDTQVAEFDTANDGTFQTSLAQGTYDFVITADGYLPLTQPVEISSDVPELPQINYIRKAGDVDNSGNINVDDLRLLLADLSRDTPLKDSDLDRSGGVNLDDLRYLLGSFAYTIQ